MTRNLLSGRRAFQPAGLMYVQDRAMKNKEYLGSSQWLSTQSYLKEEREKWQRWCDKQNTAHCPQHFLNVKASLG